MRRVIVLFTIVTNLIAGCATASTAKDQNTPHHQQPSRQRPTDNIPSTSGCNHPPAGQKCPSGYVWAPTREGCACVVFCSRTLADEGRAQRYPIPTRLEVVLDLSAPMKEHFALLRDALRCALGKMSLHHGAATIALTHARETRITSSGVEAPRHKLSHSLSWVHRELDRAFVARSDPEAPDHLLVKLIRRMRKQSSESNPLPTRLVLIAGDALSYGQTTIAKVLQPPLSEYAPLPAGVEIELLIISQDGRCAESEVVGQSQVGEKIRLRCVGHGDLGVVLRQALEGT